MQIEEYLQRKAEFDAEVQEKSKKMLVELFQELFDTGKIEKVVWTQWTPSWNDGEPCTFHLGEVAVYPKDLEDLPVDAWDSDWDSEGNLYLFDEGKYLYDPDLTPHINRIANIFHMLEDICERTFGDGVEVTITQDKNGNLSFANEWYDCGY